MADPQPQRGFKTPPEVTGYFADKGLRPAFSWQDVWGQEHAYAFTVAKATELELLTTFKASIGKALAEGQGFETWRKGMVDELRRLGWAGPRTVTDPTGKWSPAEVDFTNPRRLQTIFWSNVNAARSAGQWERAQRTKAALPYAVYGRTASADPRKEHLGWVGVMLHIDDEWWKTHWPPNGWGCKCTVRMVTGRERDRLLIDARLDRQAERRGDGGSPPGITYRTAPPDDGPPKTFVNRRTGEISTVPAGIDPGWGTNPGLSRAQTLTTRLTEQLAAAGEDDARAALASIAASPTPRVLAGLPTPPSIPVAVAPPALSAELGGARIVEAGAPALRAAAQAGDGEIGPELFARIQETLDAGTVVVEPGTAGQDRRASVFADLPDGLWRAILRGADRGRRLLLTSLGRADEAAFDEAVARERRP